MHWKVKHPNISTRKTLESVKEYAIFEPSRIRRALIYVEARCQAQKLIFFTMIFGIRRSAFR